MRRKVGKKLFSVPTVVYHTHATTYLRTACAYTAHESGSIRYLRPGYQQERSEGTAAIRIYITAIQVQHIAGGGGRAPRRRRTPVALRHCHAQACCSYSARACTHRGGHAGIPLLACTRTSMQTCTCALTCSQSRARARTQPHACSYMHDRLHACTYALAMEHPLARHQHSHGPHTSATVRLYTFQHVRVLNCICTEVRLHAHMWLGERQGRHRPGLGGAGSSHGPASGERARRDRYYCHRVNSALAVAA